MSYKVAQLTSYFATTDSSYYNINMRTILCSENFELCSKIRDRILKIKKNNN